MTDACQNSDCEEPLMPLYPPGYEPAPDEYVPEKHKIIPEEEDGEKAELEWRPKKFPFFALETADRVSTFKLVVMVTAFLFVATYNTITDVYCFTDGQLVNHSIHDFCRQTQNVHVINSTALILAVETNRTPKASDYYLFKEPVDIHYQRGPWIIGVLVLLAIFDKFCVSGIDCAFFKWIERSRWYDAMQDWPCFQDMVWISVENIMSHTKRPNRNLIYRNYVTKKFRNLLVIVAMLIILIVTVNLGIDGVFRILFCHVFGLEFPYRQTVPIEYYFPTMFACHPPDEDFTTSTVCQLRQNKLNGPVIVGLFFCLYAMYLYSCYCLFIAAMIGNSLRFRSRWLTQLTKQYVPTKTAALFSLDRFMALRHMKHAVSERFAKDSYMVMVHIMVKEQSEIKMVWGGKRKKMRSNCQCETL